MKRQFANMLASMTSKFILNSLAGKSERVFASDTKQETMSYSLQDIVKKTKKLKQAAAQTKRYIESVDEAFMTAAKKKSEDDLYDAYAPKKSKSKSKVEEPKPKSKSKVEEPKKTNKNTKVVEEDNEDNEVEMVKIAKKTGKRGRPKKKVEEVVEEAPKKRGRPPKAKEEVVEEAPKKRGRPKKNTEDEVVENKPKKKIVKVEEDEYDEDTEFGDEDMAPTNTYEDDEDEEVSEKDEDEDVDSEEKYDGKKINITVNDPKKKQDHLTVKLIEEHLGLIDKASEELESAEHLYRYATTKFGNVKSAKNAIKDIIGLVNDMKDNLESAQTTLSSIAEKSAPAIFSEEKNELLQTIIKYINKEIKEANNQPNRKEKAKINFNKSSYTIDRNDKKSLKIARYIPLENLPLLDNKGTVSLYLVINSNLHMPKASSGKLVGNFSDIYLQLIPYKTQPHKLSLYRASNIKEAKSVLSFLARENDLDVFNIDVNIRSVEIRLNKLGTKNLVPILTKIGASNIATRKNQIRISVAKKDTDLDNLTAPTTKWFKDLYVEVKRLAGLSMKAPVGRLTTDRLKLRKIVDKGKRYSIFFTVLAKSPVSEMDIDREKKRTKSVDFVDEVESVKYTKSIDPNENWIKDLKKAAKEFSDSGVSYGE